jgi:peptide/nickel transport system substrate-binding protein
VSPSGGESVERRPRIARLWHEHRARWTLPLVLIVIIGLVAIVDHLGSRRIDQVDQPTTPALVAGVGGSATVDLDQAWSGFNPNTPAGAASATPELLTSVLPSAFVINPKLVPTLNSDLLLSVEVTSTSPLVIQYVINPKARWSDGVPVSAEDFIYAWDAEKGDGVDVDGSPDQVASTLGYRDVSSVAPSHGGKTVTVTFRQPFTDWRVLFDHMVPAHIASVVGWNHGFDSFDPTRVLSAGPYLLKSVSAGGTAVLVRNPKWWGTPAALDRVTVNEATTQAAWTGSLASTNYAATQPSSFDLGALDAVSSLPNTQSAIKSSLNLVDLEFNVLSAVGERTVERQAIAHAIDRTALLARTLGPLEPDLVVSQDHLAVPAQSTYAVSSAAGEYSTSDLGTTDRLLQSIGFHKDATGHYVDVTGEPLTLRMAVDVSDPWLTQIGTEISDQLEAAGFTVTTVPIDGLVAMADAAANDTYDLALVRRVSSPYQTSTADWYSQDVGAVTTQSTEDWSNFDDPAVDQLFAKAAQALNPVTGGTIYGQIDDQLWDQMISLPLFAEPGLVANGVQLGNVEYNPSVDGLLWNVALWTTLVPGPVKTNG